MSDERHNKKEKWTVILILSTENALFLAKIGQVSKARSYGALL